MTRDEIRGLIGGYATGSLSEAERRTLFEAALEDQELFDDLAREQALKEALELPGARQRLVASLQPKPWWTTPWVWAATGAAAIAIIAGFILLRPTPNPEIARVELPPVQAPVTAAPSAPAPEPAPSPQPVPPPVRAQSAPAPAPARPIAAPVATEPLPPSEPIPAAPKQEQQKAGQQGQNAAESATVPAPGPFAPRVQAFAQGDNSPAAPPPVGALGGFPAVGNRCRSRGRRRRRGRGGRGGAAAAGRATAQGTLATPVAPRFAFDYLVTAEGVLRITPAINGFLSVQVSNGTSVTSLFRNRSVPAGSMNEIPLPADSITAIATFSLREMNPASLVIGALDQPSGTKSDPNPTADTLLVATIPVTR